MILILSWNSAYANTLLILGDSLSAAYHLPEQQGWAALLERQWQQQFPNRLIVNASISGETTAGALRRLPKLLGEHHPQWVLLELGGNDGLRGFSPNQTRDNLARLIEGAQAADAGVLLTQIRLPPNYGSRYVRAFEAVFPKLAEQYRIPLMPFFLEELIGQPDMMMADGLHPSASAQPLIAQRVGEFLSLHLND